MSRKTGKRVNSKRKRATSKKKRNRLPLILGAIGSLILIVAAVVFIRDNKTDPDFVPEVSGEPHLTVDKEQVDLGDIPINRVVRVQFELTNVGDKPLRFTQAPYTELAAGC